MEDFVSTFSKQVELVVDPFTGTLPTAKAFWELSPHRRLVGYIFDDNCFAESTGKLLET